MVQQGAQAMVMALRALFRRPPEVRVVHARGIILSGRFIASPAAARLSRAPHLQGAPVAATVRFSGSSGWRWWPDWLPDGRGLAVAFHLPEARRTDVVAINLPRFPVSRPEHFLAFARALTPRPSMAWRLPLFLLRHPRVLASLPANARALARPPASYASIAYHGIHAFTWVTPYGSERHVRYRWVPEQVRHLGWARAFCRGRHYLAQEMREHLRRGAVRLHLQVQVARPGDVLDDPAQPWPASRDLITVGTLELLAEDRSGAVTDFDPLRLVDGIMASADPVLHFRHDVYGLAARARSAAGWHDAAPVQEPLFADRAAAAS